MGWADPVDGRRSNEFKPRCHMPWQQMVIDSTGAVAPCCYWGAYENNNPPIGNLKTQTVDEIWNGEGYQALRKGMASGDLKAAGCAKCHALRQGNALGFEQDPDSEGDFTTPYAKNLRVLRQEIAEGAAVLEAKPTIVSYTPSHRCNIRCTHCYQESTRTVEVDRAEADEEIRRLAPYLVRLVAGGGEPFLLTTWKKFLSEFDLSENPYLTFSTSTNATIVSDAVVNQLEQFKNLTLNISMDGVGKTYERVRVGGEVRSGRSQCQAPSGSREARPIGPRLSRRLNVRDEVEHPRSGGFHRLRERGAPALRYLPGDVDAAERKPALLQRGPARGNGGLEGGDRRGFSRA